MTKRTRTRTRTRMMTMMIMIMIMMTMMTMMTMTMNKMAVEMKTSMILEIELTEMTAKRLALRSETLKTTIVKETIRVQEG